MKELKNLSEAGKYRFYSAMGDAKNKCLTVKENAKKQADIVLQTKNDKEGQIFSIRNYDNEYCVIVTNEEQKLVLDVCGGGNQRGAKIIQYPYHGGDNQLFRLEEKENSQYVLRSKGGRVVDISGRGTADDTPVIIWDDNGGDNQRFVVEPVSDMPDTMKEAMDSLEQRFKRFF